MHPHPTRPDPAPWRLAALALLLGGAVALVGVAWVQRVHHLHLPLRALAAWPPLAAALHLPWAIASVALPLLAAGGLAGAWLARQAGSHPAAAPGRGLGWLPALAVLPWLAAYPWATLHWAWRTASPPGAVLSLIASGYFWPGALALPLGVWLGWRRGRRRPVSPAPGARPGPARRGR